MNSSIHKFLLTLLLFLSLELPAVNWDCCESWLPAGASLEVRASYFRPTSKKVRKIYSDGWAVYGVRGSLNFCSNVQAWLGVDWSSNKGRSIGLKDRTQLRLVPITFGMNYLFNLTPCAQFYLGGGACYSILRIKDHSPYVKEHISKRTWGGIIETGINYYFTQCFFADLFVDYLFQRFCFSNSHSGYSSYVERHNVDVSGFRIGGGLGVSF